MPITDLASIVPTGNDFLANWRDLQTLLAITITLGTAYDDDAFEDDIAATGTAIADAGAKANVLAVAQHDRLLKREEAWGRVVQFRDSLRARAPGTSLVAAAPRSPRRDAGDSTIVSALDEVVAYWGQCNSAFGADVLILPGPFPLASLQTLADAFKNALADLAVKESAARIAREERDRKIAALLDRMRQYQDAANAALWNRPDLKETIPNLYPYHDGILDPVILSGVWSPGDDGAQLSWTASAAPNFSRYVLRYAPGAVEPAGTDPILQTIHEKAQTSLLAAGFFTPEAGTWSFRVWVVDDHDHVAASNTVTVSRPAWEEVPCPSGVACWPWMAPGRGLPAALARWRRRCAAARMCAAIPRSTTTSTWPLPAPASARCRR